MCSPREIFDQDMPKAVTDDLVRTWRGLYPSTYETARDGLGFRPEQMHDTLAVLRRGVGEVALVEVAERHGLAWESRQNARGNCHVVIFSGRVALTANAVREPWGDVRPADHRDEYSNQNLLFEEEQREQEARRDAAEGRIYFNLLHSPDLDPCDLGFVGVGLKNPGGRGWAERIDIANRPIATPARKRPPEDVLPPAAAVKTKKSKMKGGAASS